MKTKESVPIGHGSPTSGWVALGEFGTITGNITQPEAANGREGRVFPGLEKEVALGTTVVEWYTVGNWRTAFC